MWRSRRKSSRENDDIDGFIRTSSSKLNFIRSSLKDVENLFAEDDNYTNRFTETLGQPSPYSTSGATNAAARRLSIFHRVHLANKFTRAFSAKQITAPAKPPTESKFLEKLEKSDCVISIPVAKKRVVHTTSLRVNSPPESENLTAAKKLTKSDRVSSIPVEEKRVIYTDPVKSQPESEKLTKSEKSDRTISIPGAENRVVIYTTSLRVVRPTFEACRTVQSILQSFNVSIDERDLSMDSKFIEELQNLMVECGDDEVKKTKITLPRVFIGGRYIGGAEDVKQMHESGELKKVVEVLAAVNSGVCDGCGDFRFILCDECRRSRKCYTEKGGFRSCTLCNENGLIRCSFCLGR